MVRLQQSSSAPQLSHGPAVIHPKKDQNWPFYNSPSEYLVFYGLKITHQQNV
jgi:hypothetical protein